MTFTFSRALVWMTGSGSAAIATLATAVYLPLYLWIWGWPGGFASERFYINDNPADLPDTPFDESQMSLSNEFIKAYLLDDR